MGDSHIRELNSLHLTDYSDERYKKNYDGQFSAIDSNTKIKAVIL